MANDTEVKETEETTEETSEKKERTPRNPYGAAATELAAEAGRKLGSRVTSKQIGAVIDALVAAEVEKPIEVVGSSIKALKAYAQTGDRESLKDSEFLSLRNFVEAAKTSERLTNDSQRRRLWPRKVAAVIVYLAEEGVPEAIEPKQAAAPVTTNGETEDEKSEAAA